MNLRVLFVFFGCVGVAASKYLQGIRHDIPTSLLQRFYIRKICKFYSGKKV